MRKFGYEPYILTTYSKGDLEIPIREENIKRIGKNSLCDIISNNKIKLTLVQWILFELFDIAKIQLRSIDKVSCSWFNEVKSEVEVLNSYKNIKFDLIIGTYGPICNIMVAKFLSRKLEIPWIAEMRDFISQYDEGIQKGYKKSRFLDLIWEKYLLNSSSDIIVVSKKMKDILRKYYNKKILIIYNGWEKSSKINICSKQYKYDYLYYAGSFYEYRMPSMYLLLDALKEINKIKPMKLIIRSLGPSEFNRMILKYSNKIGIIEEVILKNPCSNNTMIEELRNATINIVLSDINTNKPCLLAELTGKLMELINIDVPILAVASPNSEIASVLDFTDKGVASDKKSDIVRYILNEHLNYKGNPKNIYRYSRKYQTKKLCNFLNKVLQ